MKFPLLVGLAAALVFLCLILLNGRSQNGEAIASGKTVSNEGNVYEGGRIRQVNGGQNIERISAVAPPGGKQAPELDGILEMLPGRSRQEALQRWALSVSLSDLIKMDIEGLTVDQLDGRDIESISAVIGGRLSRQKDLALAEYLDEIPSSVFLSEDVVTGLTSGLLRSLPWQTVVARIEGFELKKDMGKHAFQSLGFELADDSVSDHSDEILRGDMLPPSLRRSFLLSWASDDPQGATVAILEESYDDVALQNILQSSFKTWCLEEPNHAARWLEKQQASKERDKMAAVLVRHMLSEGSNDSAKEWASLIEDQKLKSSFDVFFE